MPPYRLSDQSGESTLKPQRFAFSQNVFKAPLETFRVQLDARLTPIAQMSILTGKTMLVDFFMPQPMAVPHGEFWHCHLEQEAGWSCHTPGTELSIEFCAFKQKADEKQLVRMAMSKVREYCIFSHIAQKCRRFKPSPNT